ncbi:MAG: prephenate dehydrogenase [Blastocatellia bacterium]
MMFEKLAIVGVGLIGGSFAMAAKASGLARRISGWDDRATIEEALRRGIIDEVEEAFARGGVCDADFIYLAAPVGGILDFLQTHGKLVKRGAIVTDAGSTKRAICSAARDGLAEDAHFVGGHPMAGSHERGLAHARVDLFQRSPYALIADEPAQKGMSAIALKLVIEAVRSIGAQPVVMSAERHDHVVAAVSHAPQLLATVLALSVADAVDDAMLQLAGAGFADMTRLAASHWSIWEDICATNGDEIAATLARLIVLLETLRDELANGEVAQTGTAFRRANAFMRRIQSGAGDAS